MSYPTVRVNGPARQRGRLYGTGARRQVRDSIAAYQEVFERWANWNWQAVREYAELFRAPIAAYDPRYLEEIAGIAEGADVDVLDVLAINVRTEVMFAARARCAAELGGDASSPRTSLPTECSSFAVTPARSATGRVLLGENWDWLSHAAKTLVVLEAEQDDGPNFVTVVEGGLLAKFGMNSAGIGVVVNALVTTRDLGEPAVPLHIICRAILDSETVSDALLAIDRAPRASSGNYLLAHADGVVVDVEASPGDASELWIDYPRHGVLVHTNHFVSSGFTGREVSLFAMPSSPFRLSRMRDLFEQADVKIERAFLQSVLADHAGWPKSICYHNDIRVEPADREETLAAGIFDLATRTMWLAGGSPCVTPFEALDYSTLLGKPASVYQAGRP